LRIAKVAEEIIKTVHRAGIVGAGGGGFPTHIKLDSQVDTLIGNGSECEPLLQSDRTLLKEKPHLVIEGMSIVMNTTGANTGYIAVKEKYSEVIAAVKNALKGKDNIKIHPLENYYPAGDEFLTVYDVTKRIIPEGGIPLQVGVLVSNVLTLAQIANAVHGKPVTERPITIGGSVNRPLVVTVPIGTLYKDLIKLAGGTKNPTDILFDGGPMMGNIVEDLNQGIAKTTCGIIALPHDHYISRMKGISISQMVKKSKAACCQCIRCSDLCPRNLIGHQLFPHRTMRTIDYNLSEPTEHITSAFLCSQCGVCELIACDVMFLSPRKIYSEYLAQLKSKGISNPHKRPVQTVFSEYESRKVPLSTVMKKVDLAQFDINPEHRGYQKMGRVCISLNKHTGEPATPQVARGEMVKMGDIIASSPADGPGAVYHASISGKIDEVAETWIKIINED
jgi:Na+-translocating ferredoxin:NAD+ oxidoreductase RnfC subunit